MSNRLCAPYRRVWLGAVSMLTAHIFSASAEAHISELDQIASYTIQLQNVGRDIDQLSRSESDLIIIEPSYSDLDGKRRILGKAELARLKQKPDGTRRIVLAYMSVGEAEDYRDYWQPGWTANPPAWIVSENCRWRGNHLIRFWSDEWRRLLVSDRNSVLRGILDTGFDGVSLDRVDVFEELEHINPEARTAMIDLVADIAAEARKNRPEFIVMAHNPENLLTSTAFRKLVDGVLKEDLLYGANGKENRNPAQSIAWSQNRLAMMSAEGKPVLVAEYLSDGERADETELELLDRSFIPGIFARALDGSNPFTAVAEQLADMAADAGGGCGAVVQVMAR